MRASAAAVGPALTSGLPQSCPPSATARSAHPTSAPANTAPCRVPGVPVPSATLRDSPLPTDPVVAMFRRSLALLLVVLAAAFVVTGPAFASGKDVIRDQRADGVIDKCYSAAEFTRALELARNEDAQYAAIVDAVNEKRFECTGGAPPVATTPTKDGGSNTALWAIVVAALAAGAVAFGVAARKRRDDDVGS
jgi:hypothetical protein